MNSIINKLIQDIVQISFDNLPVENNWKHYQITASVLTKMVEINANYYDENFVKHSFNPKYQGQVSREDDLTFIFMDLRKEMYNFSPNQGAWYDCSIKVYPAGKFETEFNYDNKPEFKYEPSKDKFEQDLKTYPRENILIPKWLEEIIN